MDGVSFLNSQLPLKSYFSRIFVKVGNLNLNLAMFNKNSLFWNIIFANTQRPIAFMFESEIASFPKTAT